MVFTPSQATRWWLGVLLVGLTLSGCRRLDRELFSSLDRLGRQVIVALSTNAPVSRLREFRDDLAAEVRGAESRASSSAELDVLRHFKDASGVLDDLLTIADRRGDGSVELLAVSDPVVARIWKQYDLPINTNEPPSIYASEALTATRRALRETLVRATDALAP